MVRCSKCGTEVETPTKFCGACGKKFVPIPEPVSAGAEEGLYYCSRHKKEPTRVQCGRCGRPICGKCMVHGPAGVRCKQCARNKVAIRPRGVLHDLGAGTGGAQTVWYLAIFAFIASIFSGLFGGRRL